MKYLPFLLLAILPLTGCATRAFNADGGFVQNDFLNKKRGDKTSFKITYPTGVTVEYNNTVVGMDNTSVANTAIGAYGLVTGLKETTAQRASDNALRATQAREATNQTRYLVEPTVYDPALKAVSRAGGKPFIP